MMFGLGKIKLFVYGAIAAIGAGLYFALRIVMRQRDKAREAAERARRKKAIKKSQLERSRRISQSKNKARKEAQEYAEKEQDRIDSGDRPDSWGSGDRLSKKD